MEFFGRDVVPLGDPNGEYVVLLGALDELAAPLVGQSRPVVASNRANDILIAPADKNVGDRLADRAALGNREKMRLALGGCRGDQFLLAQPH